MSGGEDKDRLLEERKNLRRQLRKAETSLWRSKEEECKKGRKKLGSKLITSKEDYLKALVDKGIRRELRRSDRIREYWTRQQEKNKEQTEEKQKEADLNPFGRFLRWRRQGGTPQRQRRLGTGE